MKAGVSLAFSVSLDRLLKLWYLDAEETKRR